MTRTPSIRLMYMNTIVQKLMTYPLLIAPLRDGYGKGQSYIELILEMKNEPFSSNDLVVVVTVNASSSTGTDRLVCL